MVSPPVHDSRVAFRHNRQTAVPGVPHDPHHFYPRVRPGASVAAFEWVPASARSVCVPLPPLSGIRVTRHIWRWR
jgi:hypothetical protein